jgi:glycosyltransferase involved in cell wall biosynthesis
MPQFTIITAFRNRDLLRVKNSLDSLAAQTYADFEFIFIDYGSDFEFREQTKTLIESYLFAKYMYTEVNGRFWSRAHAFNTGIQKAAGTVCILWDIDFIAEPVFLHKLSVYNFNTHYLMIACMYFPEIQNLAYSKFEQVKHLGVLGSGGMCVVNRQGLLSIEGFDEFYQVWGAEDDDLYNRLQLAGLQRKQTDAAELAVYHQWHPTQAPALPDMWYMQMVEHLFSAKPRQQNEFGLLFTAENRPALNAYQNGTYKQLVPIELETGNKTLLYNKIIQESLQNIDSKGFYIEFRYLQLGFSPKSQQFMTWFNRHMEMRKLNFRLVNHQQQERKELQTNIYAFLKYFIGTRRAQWLDYYLHWHADGFVLVYFVK